MKKCIVTSTLFIAFLALLLMGGCGAKNDGPLTGDWAYIHDTQTSIINIKNNNTAIYNGKKYSCEVNDDYICLTSGSENFKLRYETTKDGFLMYQSSEYEYMDEGTPDSVIGNWYNKATKWSYEFTADGNFKEDGYFPGIYSVDSEKGTIKLMYNDHFEDTVIYYSIDGNKLTIDYPWTMVKKN